MKCCDLTASMLKHRVRIERLNLVEDDIGGQSHSWTLILEPWAYIKQTSGNEFYQAERLNGLATFKAVIRYNPLVTEVTRLVYAGKSYQIRSVENIEFANKFMNLTLESGVPT